MRPSVTVCFLILGQAANWHSQTVKRVQRALPQGVFGGRLSWNAVSEKTTVSASACNTFLQALLLASASRAMVKIGES